MTIKRFIFIAFLLATSTCVFSTAQGSRRTGDPAAPAENAKLIARGQYIVQDVAVCGQCHTPRDSNGQPEPHHQLEGGPVWFQPAAPMADWPLKAPRLAGTPPASEADMVRLLTTGIWTNGQHLRPPMPQFRMTKEDAEAVVAYLRSLTPNRP
jgi:mono/diheme cytochrome c family protein